MTTASDFTVTLGRIVGVYGVRGMVKVHSECRPRESIFQYRQLLATSPQDGTLQILTLQHGRIQGQSLVASFQGITDRDQAHALKGHVLSVKRSELPTLPQGEFYWTDLLDLQVINCEGVLLGRVAEIFETGANDVLVVRKGKQEVLIPLVMKRYVLEIDMKMQCMTVDWNTAWLTD